MEDTDRQTDEKTQLKDGNTRRTREEADRKAGRQDVKEKKYEDKRTGGQTDRQADERINLEERHTSKQERQTGEADIRGESRFSKNKPGQPYWATKDTGKKSQTVTKTRQLHRTMGGLEERLYTRKEESH